MPVKSYLVIPLEGQKEKLLAELAKLPSCETLPAENKDVLVVVTDTPNEEEDKKLFNQLTLLSGLKHLNLVSAFSE